jgi:hypothetical protein
MDHEYLYHWTRRKNVASIARRGLLTCRSEGKRPLVWACEGSRVAWALTHVADRHAWNPDDLVLIRLRVGAITFKHSAYAGAYHTATDIPADMIEAVRFGILAQWVTVPVCHFG